MSSEEYLRRLETPFSPPTHTISELRAAVPKHLYKKSTLKSLHYVFRDLLVAGVLGYAATHIDSVTESSFDKLLQCERGPLEMFNGTAPTFSSECIAPPPLNLSPATVKVVAEVTRWSLWIVYMGFQSLAMAGIWCLAHELGHGTLFSNNYANQIIGFFFHTIVLAPYHSWRATHHAHHKAAGSIERDENYVPSLRSSLKLPEGSRPHEVDYHEIFEETPLYTLGRMAIMQLFGWQAYLSWNALGSPMYPPGTNHFNPFSPLFRPGQRFYIFLSDLAVILMSGFLAYVFRPYGLNAFLKYYFIPYLFANNWIVMLTYLHHTDPSIPHYRKDEWTYLRGACATVDRPLLGWIGRFFFHNVSHDHIAHHYFSMIPFYNQPEVTKAIKPVLGHSYNYDSTNSFYALYRSFTECLFIEDDDPIAFYRNKDGVTQRSLAPEALGLKDAGDHGKDE